MHALYTFTFFSQRVAFILSADHCLIAFCGSDDPMNSCWPVPTDKLRLRVPVKRSSDFRLGPEGDDTADADDTVVIEDDEFKGGDVISFLSSFDDADAGACAGAADDDDDEDEEED